MLPCTTPLPRLPSLLKKKKKSVNGKPRKMDISFIHRNFVPTDPGCSINAIQLLSPTFLSVDTVHLSPPPSSLLGLIRQNQGGGLGPSRPIGTPDLNSSTNKNAGMDIKTDRKNVRRSARMLKALFS